MYCSCISAPIRISLGVSKFPYNEALHFRSPVLESHDDIAEGRGLFSSSSFVLYGYRGVVCVNNQCFRIVHECLRVWLMRMEF